MAFLLFYSSATEAPLPSSEPGHLVSCLPCHYLGTQKDPEVVANRGRDRV